MVCFGLLGKNDFMMGGMIHGELKKLESARISFDCMFPFWLLLCGLIVDNMVSFNEILDNYDMMSLA